MVFDADSALSNFITHLGKRCKAQRAYWASYNSDDDRITTECEWYKEGMLGLQSLESRT